MIIKSSLRDVAGGVRRQARRAFTLVEVLIAVGVSVLVFGGMYSAISNCYSMLQTSRANLRATQIMVSQLEGVRLCAWGTGTNITQLFNSSIVVPAFTNYFYPLGLNGTTNLGIPYYGTVSVVQLTNALQQTNVFGGTPPSYANNMALVTVTVSWTNGLNGKGVGHTRHMTSLVAAYGIQNYVYNH